MIASVPIIKLIPILPRQFTLSGGFSEDLGSVVYDFTISPSKSLYNITWQVTYDFGPFGSSGGAVVGTTLGVPSGRYSFTAPIQGSWYAFDANFRITASVTCPLVPGWAGGKSYDFPEQEIVIRSLGPQDDDLSVRVGATRVFDTKLHSSWYHGETQTWFPGVGGVKNPAWQTEGWRIARLTRSAGQAKGTGIRPGMIVSVDAFDGWGNGGQKSPWEATVKWPGQTRIYTGGTAAPYNIDFSSELPYAPDYFDVAAHHQHYEPNGSFTL